MSTLHDDDTHFPTNFTICQRILGPCPWEMAKNDLLKKNYAVGKIAEGKLFRTVLVLKFLGLLFAGGTRGALCVEMGFYADIFWESRCNIEINV